MSMNSKHKTHPADKAVKRKRHQLGGFEKTITQQALAPATDINNIMAKYRKTGLIDHINQNQGRYADFSGATEFQEAQNLIAEAQQSFEQLPAEIRQKFENDPAQFLDFVKNEDNIDKMIEMGLVQRTEPPKDVGTKGQTSAPEGAPEAPEEE